MASADATAAAASDAISKHLNSSSSGTAISREDVGRALELLPEEEKRDVLQALRRVPELVEMESNPLKFLQREDFNVEKAVHRLALYWKFRCEYFGRERAFLPMTITGFGALQDSEIRALRTCMYMPLQGTRPILFYDKAMNYLKPVDIRKRVLFYFIHIMSEDEVSSTEGFTLLGLFNSLNMDESSRSNAKFAIGGSPAKVKLAHVFCQVPENQSSFARFFARFAVIFLNLVGLTQLWRTLLHSSAKPESQLDKILALGLGLTKHTIPPHFGGTYTEEKFAVWIQERQQLERQRYQGFYAAHQNPTALAVTSRRSSVAFGAGVGGGDVRMEDILEQLRSREDSFPSQQQILQGLQSQVEHRAHSITATPGFSPFGLGTEDYIFNRDPFIQTLPRLNLRGGESMFPGSPSPGFGIGGSFQGLSLLNGGMAQQVPAAAVKLAKLVSEAMPAAKAKRDNEFVDPYEKLGINYDNVAIEETESIRNIARMAVDESLHIIPGPAKTAYLEAVRCAPQLMENESKVIHYLRCANYDPYAAACRLVKYWHIRKVLFRERAFLPMEQTGWGALTRDDVVILSSGVVAMLPNDNAGRNVVAEDRSRMVENSEEAKLSMLKSIFYLLSLLSEDENSRDEGIVWLNIAITPRVAELWEDAAVKSLEILESFPVRIKAVHVLVCPPKAGKRKKIDEIVAFILHIYMEKFGRRAILSAGDHASNLKDKLQKFGLEEASLPLNLGGNWAYEGWMKLLRQRLREEQSRSNSTFAPAKAVAVTMNSTRDVAALPQTEEEKRERKRKLNVIHSRQKRERKRALMTRLEDECRELEGKNRALQADNARLEHLLEQSASVLAEHGISADVFFADVADANT